MRLLATSLLFASSLTRSTPTWAQGPFVDVPSNHPAAAAVSELAKRGLILGYPDSHFRGDRPMTRYEVVAAVWRLLQEPLQRHGPLPGWPTLPVMGPPPTDVPASHWAERAVTQLHEWGILAGYPDATFRGRQVMTEGELAVILQRVRAFAARLMELERLRKGRG